MCVRLFKIHILGNKRQDAKINFWVYCMYEIRHKNILYYQEQKPGAWEHEVYKM